jgi:hypothetical protein
LVTGTLPVEAGEKPVVDIGQDTYGVLRENNYILGH